MQKFLHFPALGKLFFRRGDLQSRLEAERSAQTAIASVRLAMVELLQSCDAFETSLVHRVLCATHAETLWYLRSDVLKAVAMQHGERIAREKIRSITDRFQGLVPEHFIAECGLTSLR